MCCGRIMMPPKIEDIPINRAPNPCAVVLSRKIAMKPWPKKVNVPKLNAMKSQYRKNFAASGENPTVKYHRIVKTKDASTIKGTSQRRNDRFIAL
mmetsp:Transcript_7206/g.16607  ORF Transcript_7206/g.16607 Transcript_7206/m.16607 type:complete len:95 (-) Transcript_7206:3956-4240(-)